jgi:hypothetical protein
MFVSCENWEDVFFFSPEVDVNIAFSNFLNTFLRIFYSCFPLEKFQYVYMQKSW